VNFFGHATVACWFDRDPRFVFGAMLPDLAAMLRLRPPASSSPAITRGIALHHATDSAFHGAPAFLALAQSARVSLLALGLGRGPARALAHVGTEILLDERLGTEPEVEATYLAALEVAGTAPLGEAETDDTRRLRALASTLRARGVPRFHSPELVARRLYRALESHPRLAFTTSDEPRVASWVIAFRPQVAAAASAVVCDLSVRLSVELGSSARAGLDA
jgi:hypothetical protein